MTAIKRHKTLFDGSAAGAGEWFRLDTRYQDMEAAIQVFVTNGDTIHFEGCSKDVRGANQVDVIASITDDEISTLKSFTEDTAEVLVGPWAYVRIRKEGTTGPAKVLGYL